MFSNYTQDGSLVTKEILKRNAQRDVDKSMIGKEAR